MNEGRIVLRYAKAFLMANPSDTWKALHGSISDFLPVYEQIHEEAEQVFVSSVVSIEEKEKFLLAFTNRYCPPLSPLASLVVRKGRELYFLRMLYAILRLLAKELGIVRVQLESAMELSPHVLNRLTTLLQQQLACKEISLEYKINEGLIGGFRLLVDGRLLDKSVLGELDVVRRNWALY